jgi:small redox-active disulfide protein 2
MRIEILGPGCTNCRKLEENVRRALEETGKKAEVEKITDIRRITEKIMFTPGLVIDGKVKSEGRIPGVDEIKEWLG